MLLRGGATNVDYFLGHARFADVMMSICGMLTQPAANIPFHIMFVTQSRGLLLSWTKSLISAHHCCLNLSGGWSKASPAGKVEFQLDLRLVSIFKSFEFVVCISSSSGLASVDIYFANL